MYPYPSMDSFDTLKKTGVTFCPSHLAALTFITPATDSTTQLCIKERIISSQKLPKYKPVIHQEIILIPHMPLVLHH